MTSYFQMRMAEINAQREASLAAGENGFRMGQNEERRRANHSVTPAAGYVYFMRCCNEVKIGFSANPRNRASQLRTANAGKAFMVKFIAGPRSLEGDFHKRFAEYRIRGEWFDLRGRLAKYLERDIYPVEFPEPIEPEEEDIRL